MSSPQSVFFCWVSICTVKCLVEGFGSNNGHICAIFKFTSIIWLSDKMGYKLLGFLFFSLSLFNDELWSYLWLMVEKHPTLIKTLYDMQLACKHILLYIYFHRKVLHLFSFHDFEGFGRVMTFRVWQDDLWLEASMNSVIRPWKKGRVSDWDVGAFDWVRVMSNYTLTWCNPSSKLVRSLWIFMHHMATMDGIRIRTVRWLFWPWQIRFQRVSHAWICDWNPIELRGTSHTTSGLISTIHDSRFRFLFTKN
jgi:hypothetical protein